jgi:hypothetical protein
MDEGEKHAYEVMMKAMRERQAAERKAVIEKHEAAMQALIERFMEETCAAMQA